MKNNNNTYSIEPIGYICSPYKEKFAVPRQPGLAPDIVSIIEFYPPYNDENAFIELDGFSHLYLLFIFNKINYEKFRAKVRPPRLGGNKSIGVFATRSPFRPNQIGLSIVKIKRIIREHAKVRIEVLGADLVDNTPIIDIKPYIPFVDAIPEAKGGFAPAAPKVLKVEYQEDCYQILKNLDIDKFKAIDQSLSYDPRPAYKEKEQDDKVYQARLYDFTLSFKVEDEIVKVIKVEEL